MALVPVLALQPFTYARREVQAGEVCQMDPYDAILLLQQQKISVDGMAVRKAQLLAARVIKPSQPASEPVPRTRRRYKRRDMVAE